MQPLLTCEQMRAADRAAMAAGIPGRILMENAATAALRRIQKAKPRKTIVLCGKGNNGGDGLAVARRLHIAGIETTVYLACERMDLEGDALLNLRAAEAVGVPVRPFSAACAVEAETLLVDALLGIGVRGEVKGKIAEAISWIEKSGCRCISLDIPSGISGNTGSVCGMAVHAAETVTFGARKIGLCSPLSLPYVGKVVVDDISIPAVQTRRFLLEKSDVHPPRLSPSAHKGERGHAVFLGGSTGMAGAAVLAASAAEIGGAGRVTAMVPEALLPIMMARLTGVMCGDAAGEIPRTCNALLVGCGLGRDEYGAKVLRKAISTEAETLIIDADGLYHLSADKAMLCHMAAHTILTPHMGEMSRLTGIPILELTENRVEIAEDFADTFGVTVVLKGAGTVVAEPKGRTYINMTGNAGMAKGGSGDILAGLMLGFAACGWENPAAAAVYVHGVCGDMAADAVGPNGLTAETLLNFLPKAIKCM